MSLPDVNVWLALTFQSHVHHVAAKEWFDTVADGSCLFCRMTQQRFLRLATNPKAFGSEAVSMTAAWDLYDALAGDPRVGYVDEPPDVESVWRGHTKGQMFSPKVWNDSYLSALAQAAGLEMVTFDKGFAQYTGVSCTILS